MDHGKTCAVLIVAAGRGSRLNAAHAQHGEAADNGQPKQYKLLNNKPVLTYSLEAFNAHPAIDYIATVIHPADQALYNAAIGSIAQPDRGADKLLAPVTGGATRQASVYAGLKALEAIAPDLVLIHDAARPFISAQLITRIITSLEDKDCPAALPVIAVSDTLKRGANGVVQQTLDRSEIWAAQTPQGFHYSLIAQAHHEAQNITGFTDDASIIEWKNISVKFIEGDERNSKITTAQDMRNAQSLIQNQTQIQTHSQTENSSMPNFYPAIGTGYDVHAFTDGSEITLCGVTFPFEKRLKGHSDADVGLHAATDAIFGALAEGDIGSHFPPSDEKWKGAKSDIFLKFAAERVKARGGTLQHLDITLICEHPKIGPHRDAMRRAIADMLALRIENISVKATTTERLGFTGRKEGIAALATATILLPLQESNSENV